MRFLSWVCGNFWRGHDHFRRFQKKSEQVQRLPKKSEVFRSLRTCIKASSLPVFFSSQIRDREEGIVIYSFYTWFSFLTWVWVNIFLEIVSSMLARGQQLTFFNQAWEIGHWSLIGPQAILGDPGAVSWVVRKSRRPSLQELFRSCKLGRLDFLTTQLTAPGSPRMPASVSRRETEVFNRIPPFTF